MASNSKKNMRVKCLLALISCLLLPIHQQAFAEKADRAKNVEITYARLLSNIDQSDLTVEGDVVLAQGTLRITAERMRVKKDAKENVTAEIFGNTTQQLTFREKRDGSNEFIEGSADRAEFDQGANTLKLFSRAAINSGGNLLSGEYLSYNRVTSEFNVNGVQPGSKGVPTTNGRGKLVIPPPKDAAESASEKK
jgi:lipopolysaccharide export system protein LptA